MSIFNELLRIALETGIYTCPKCMGFMELIEEGDTLWCPECGFDQPYDHYGFTDEEYEEAYPILENTWEVFEDEDDEEDNEDDEE